MRPHTYTLVVALTAGLLTQVFGVGPAWATVPVLVARYTFDSRSGTVVDESGRGHTMTMVASHGGALKSVVHGNGEGLAFPTKCAGRRRPPCPHAVLQSPDSADLNPGIRTLAYGATVRLARTQTSKGQNVIQKGYSATSSQYKLQVDGIAGRPSCVLVDDRKAIIELVRSAVSVADGTWHTIECSRAGGVFTIVVDGAISGAMRIPAGLSVTNSSPLSIGGKGTSRDNDQFQGAVDDVWVRIG
jgi:Concanavalin A-like lectin/glucanases superfamily